MEKWGVFFRGHKFPILFPGVEDKCGSSMCWVFQLENELTISFWVAPCITVCLKQKFSERPNLCSYPIRNDNTGDNILANKFRPKQFFAWIMQREHKSSVFLIGRASRPWTEIFYIFLLDHRLVNAKSGRHSRDMKLSIFFLWKCNIRLM